MNAHVEIPTVSLLPDGIHFNLADDTYHADPALGSTNIRDLIDNAPDYWWSSWMNPAREPEKETPAKLFGHAVHKAVLEGRAAFEARYAACDHPGNIKAGMAERQIIADAGKVGLRRDEYNRILAAAAFIRANENLAAAFSGGFPEVSVFWTVDGVRLKARFDYLKMRAISDLKSIRNPLNKTFVQACRDRIAGYDYAVQACHYMEGRRQMAAFVKSDAVFGPPETEKFRSWLIQAAGIEAFAFVFVFWQAEGAPISHGFQISPGNPILSSARQSITQAIWNYRRYLDEFGTTTAWVPTTPLDELDETDLPIWWQVRQNTGK